MLLFVSSRTRQVSLDTTERQTETLVRAIKTLALSQRHNSPTGLIFGAPRSEAREHEHESPPLLLITI